MSKDKKITVTVVSDILCPWCYIGYKELVAAVDKLKSSHPDAQVDIEYRPFLLDPKLNCKEPVDKKEYFLKKFGPQRLKTIVGVLDPRGLELGIKFKWDGTLRQTTSCHRVLLYAYQKDPKLQLALMEKMFQSYFEENVDIGDPQVIAALSEEVGVMDKAEALEFLKSDKLLKEVQAYLLEAQQKGVTGVPFTVINQRYAVCGGQKSDVYVNTFEKLITVGEIS